MKQYIFLIALVFGAIHVKAQEVPVDNNPATYAKTITTDDLKKHLSIIASDDFQGRETGSEGLAKAGKYITKQLAQMGIQPLKQLDNSYYQPVKYKRVAWGNVKVTANGKEFNNMRDFYTFAGISENMPEIKANEITFLGYGIDTKEYSDYDGVDVKGKVIVIYSGEPTDKSENYLISGNTVKSGWDFRRKLNVAKKKGVKLVLIIEPNTLKNINKYGRWLIEPSFKLAGGKTKGKKPSYANHLFVSPTMLKKIMGRKYKKLAKANKKIKKKGKPKNFTFKSKFVANLEKKDEILNSPNILGFIEGSDPKLKDEIVVVSAHYDHLGYRGDDIFNGADDNGSGTTGILEMAQAFSIAKTEGAGPRRSVLFLWVAGEEKGLLGSKYYSENPVFPLENTIADVNVDMIGRVDEIYEKAGNPNYIYVIGSDRLSTELHKINEEANQKYGDITLDYKYNDEKDPNRYYYRSDHYNFAKHGIPSIFYFSGTHKDYHKTSDTVDKIQFDKMQKIAILIFHTAWELSNRDERIKVDVEQKK